MKHMCVKCSLVYVLKTLRAKATRIFKTYNSVGCSSCSQNGQESVESLLYLIIESKRRRKFENPSPVSSLHKTLGFGLRKWRCT